VSTEDTIVVNIDDSQLAAVELRLNMLGVEAVAITGSKNLERTLPAIDRNMRLILGRIPGMRQLMQAYFRLAWIERGVQKIPEEGYLPLSLTLLATLVLLVKANEARIKKLERLELRREMWIKKERGITHEQYLELMEKWQVEFRRVPG